MFYPFKHTGSTKKLLMFQDYNVFLPSCLTWYHSTKFLNAWCQPCLLYFWCISRNTDLSSFPPILLIYITPGTGREHRKLATLNISGKINRYILHLPNRYIRYLADQKRGIHLKKNLKCSHWYRLAMVYVGLGALIADTQCIIISVTNLATMYG